MSVVAIWLLATQHCGLEAAGLVVDPSHTLACCAQGANCNHGCKSVEEGAYRFSGEFIKVPAPDLLAWLGLMCATPVITDEAGRLLPPEPSDRPSVWVAPWQFVQRAALSPRAPSFGLA